MSNEAATFAKHLLEHSFRSKASDIHFQPSPIKNDVFIYYRVLGSRTFIQSISKTFYQIIITYFKFSAAMDIGETRKPQNGTITWYDSANELYHLRLSTLPVVHSESLTIRIFPQKESPSLEQLFLFPKQYKRMKQWLNYKAGLIIFTGPTGSGKSTTMYALLKTMLEQKSYQAITLEEPVERKLEHVLQVEVNERAGITYQTGLKAALRHDPDVLLIGEIRDEKTAKFVIQAALTGHLVLTTLHAKNALSTIDRLLDLGVPFTDLKHMLIAVAAIQLLPIQRYGKIDRRAAIVEMLDKNELEAILDGKTVKLQSHNTFQALKEKAYRYGFITKTTLDESSDK